VGGMMELKPPKNFFAKNEDVTIINLISRIFFHTIEFDFPIGRFSQASISRYSKSPLTPSLC
jgi:hypothetical protein